MLKGLITNIHAAIFAYGLAFSSWAMNQKAHEYVDFGAYAIPLECGQLMFCHLPLHNISTISIVCKNFNNALNNEILWKYFYYRMSFQDGVTKEANLSWKQFLKKKISLKNYMLRMNKWDNRRISEALEDHHFNLWKMDLLHNNSILLKGFQRNHSKGSQRDLIRFLVAYYLVFVKIPVDTARALSLFPENQNQESPCDWHVAYTKIHEIVKEPIVFLVYEAVPKNILDDLIKELKTNAEEVLLPTIDKFKQDTKETPLPLWRLANLYFIARLSDPRTRTKFFQPIFDSIFAAVEKNIPNDSGSLLQLTSINLMLRERDNPEIRFLVEVLNHPLS